MGKSGVSYSTTGTEYDPNNFQNTHDFYQQQGWFNNIYLYYTNAALFKYKYLRLVINMYNVQKDPSSCGSTALFFAQKAVRRNP